LKGVSFNYVEEKWEERLSMEKVGRKGVRMTCKKEESVGSEIFPSNYRGSAQTAQKEKVRGKMEKDLVGGGLSGLRTGNKSPVTETTIKCNQRADLCKPRMAP